MNPFRSRGLKFKLSVSVFVVLISAFFVTTYVVEKRVFNLTRKMAFETAGQMANRYAEEIEKKINSAFTIPKHLAVFFAGLKEKNETVDRELFSRIIKDTLESSPNVFGIWNVWESNALDGKDAQFIGVNGNDAAGRFVAYWNRAGGIHMEPCVDYDDPGKNGEYYRIPLETKKDYITEPVTYKIAGQDITVSSMTSPIIYHDQVLGVIGADFTMEQLEQTVQATKPYEDGYGFILAHNGMVVAHADKTLQGKQISQKTVNHLYAEAYEALKKGNGSAFVENDIYVYTVPIQVGMTDAYWGVGVVFPMKKVMADAIQLRGDIILIGFLTSFIVIIFMVIMGHRIVSPLIDSISILKKNVKKAQSTSNEVAESNHLIAEGASEQAASIEETSASLEQMAAMTRQNSENTNKMMEMGNQITQVIENSKSSISRTNDSISAMKNRGREISSIINTIEDIAFQTNLLALNAAIEAARAGEAGAGFSVVADEVRNLAAKSSESAGNTQSLIEEIVREIDTGYEQLACTQEQFGRIKSLNDQIQTLIGGIATASSDQADGALQIARAVAEMDKVVQQNASGAEEASALTMEMNSQTQQMELVIQRLVQLVYGRKNGNAVLDQHTYSSEKKAILALKDEISPGKLLSL